ncbi:MAG: transposase, partial [Chloroflexota bacterium]
REQKRLLKSVKGFGNVTAHLIMAEMYDLADYENAHAAAADAGVNPSHYQSGETVHRKSKMSKIGKRAVRRGLYMPALAAIRSNPIVRELAERLEKLGKPTMVIIGAAMRKLIHIAYGVLKNKAPFDPTWETKSATAIS